MVTGYSREKAKALAYVLWNEFNAKQTDIAQVLSVSEPTISLWLKEMRFRAEIHQLGQELAEVRGLAQSLISTGQVPSPPPPFGGILGGR